MDSNFATIQINKNYTKQLLITIGCVVLLGIFQPVLWSVVEVQVHDFQQKRFQSEQLKEIQHRIESINKTQSEQKALLDELDLAIPPKGTLTKILDGLDFAAAKMGVGLQLSGIIDSPESKANQDSALVTKTIQVEVTGSPAEVLQFLDSIEYMPELTTVSKWSLAVSSVDNVSLAAANPSETVGNNSRINAQLRITIMFYLKNTANANS